MNNARYAPPLSEWGADIEVMVVWHQGSTLNGLVTGHYRTLKQYTVTREQRAEYEKQLREVVAQTGERPVPQPPHAGRRNDD